MLVVTSCKSCKGRKNKDVWGSLQCPGGTERNTKLSDSSQAQTIGFSHESNEVNLAIVGRAVTLIS